MLWRTLIGAIPMITMAESAANWRNTDTHMDRTHFHSHTWHQHSYNQVVPSASSALLFPVHAGSFRVSVIHRTLTWTTGYLTCVRDHSNIKHSLCFPTQVACLINHKLSCLWCILFQKTLWINSCSCHSTRSCLWRSCQLPQDEDLALQVIDPPWVI